MRASARHPAILALLSLLAVSACSRGSGDAILVFGAASLSDVLEVHAEYYLTTRGLARDAIRFHFQGSNACAAQIRQGAPADLFLSADDAVVIDLAHRGFIERQGYQRLVRNRLALIVPSRYPSPIESIEDLAGAGWRRLALGNPDSVPAGRYGKAALESLGLWRVVESRVLRAEHVRQALLYVARGEAEAGLVYATDAEIEPGVEIVELINGENAPPILYSGGVISGSRRSRAARAFLTYLGSHEAAAIWRRFGFLPLTGRTAPPGLPAE